ncbi:hypothetical protein [Nocardia colli]|uniref:hypothetical protein n=1 Tax=Nocardia colli TaxID=2545717 RepID=UPI0035E0B11C
MAVHTHRLGALILDLIERETAVALVLPTLRACYEAALTAHWIAQSKNATFAMNVPCAEVAASFVRQDPAAGSVPEAWSTSDVSGWCSSVTCGRAAVVVFL